VDAEGLADQVAWVTVERGEHEAQRFWLSVIDQLAAAAGRDGFVERVAATPAFGGQAVVERLLSDLQSIEQPVVLVIDDLHELQSQEALQWLGLFLAGFPPEFRVVLITREDPDIGLHRLRLSGALTEIRDLDLRFSLQETRELIDASGIRLSDTAVARLHARTEGWAAGLRLAAISLAAHPDPERFVAEFSGSERTVAGYLLAEVLAHQPPEVRDLLLRTSVLERVCGPLADALTGGTGSEAQLQDLEDANAFVTSLDVGRTWFRYHHLLADLLALELRRSSPAIIEPLHRTAALWFEEHGYVVESVRHAQAAGDWEHAGRLLADNYVDLVFDGRKATLRASLGAFPVDAPEQDPELALAFATGRLYDGLLDESAAYIAAAERRAARVPQERRRVFDLRLASATLWQACQLGDLDAARQAMRSFEAQSADSPARADDHRASALMNLGVAELWSLHMDAACRNLEEALALARRIGRPYLEIGCLGYLALAAVVSGSSVPDALRLSEEAVTIAEAHGWGTHRIVGPAVAAGAAALAWLGRLDEAERWLERVEREKSTTDESEIEPVLHYARGFVRLGQSRFADALDDFRATERLQRRHARQHALSVDVPAWILHAQILMGDTGQARAGLAALGPQERERAGMRIAAAELALADHRPQNAAAALAPLTERAPEPMVEDPGQVLSLRRAMVHALLLEAVARDQLDDLDGAEASVEQALELTELDGMMLPFLLVPVRDLLERHPVHRTAHAALLARIRNALAGSLPQPEHQPAPLQDPLSDAELRVARFLPSNLKSPEIAAELFVSTNTVRTHMRHIYSKLDAHSRSEAVARARELGLLAPGSRVHITQNA
jgi:LuxR family maltose regulon positive regulatory protein